MQNGITTTSIQVGFTLEGVHHFPGATDPKFATGDQYDVSHLAHPHSHYFEFKVSLQVLHDDRDVEFLQFRRWLMNLYSERTLELNHKSCEMIARDLVAKVNEAHPDRSITVSVFEDRYNGAELSYTPFPISTAFDGDELKLVQPEITDASA